MPKLRRRMRVGGVNLVLPANISNNSTTNNPLIINNMSTDSAASSSQSVQQDDRPIMGELCQEGFVYIMFFANDNDDVQLRLFFPSLDC
jgi:hypothetical protein